MEKLLKQALAKADAAEVFHGDYRKAEVSYESGKLKVVNSVRMTGAALRVIKDGRLGFASSTDLSQTDRMISLALDTAVAGPAAKFGFPGPSPDAPKVDTMLPTATKLGLDELVDMGSRFIDKLKKLAPEAYGETSITVDQSKQLLINSSGLSSEFESAIYSVYFGATVVKGSDVLMVPAFSIPIDCEYNPEKAAEEVNEKLKRAEVIAEAETGPMTVLFSPLGMDSMLLSLSSAFSGKAVMMGVSPIKDLVGKKALSEKLTIWNDSTVKYWPRSGGLDHEGMLTKKSALVEKGVIGSPYYDLLTADMHGKKSTGNGFRGSFEVPPGPTPSLVTVEPGDMKLADMLESMEDGLFVDFCLGVGQGNYMAGEFSTNVGLGYRVKGGKIVGRVKNVMLAGNAYDLLFKNLVGLSSERSFSMTMCLTPYMLVDGVSVTAKK
jgi:PmbA protein